MSSKLSNAKNSEPKSTKFSLKKVQDLLQASDLKVTSLRSALLEILLNSNEPCSQGDLIKKVEGKITGTDRVSIYRNLQQFKSSGLIHEVEKNHYVSCAHECNSHPHFLLFCGGCQKHEEVRDHSRVDQLMKTLKGLDFFGFSGPIHLKGLCSQCQNS